MKTRKKIIVLVVLLALVLSGCGNKKEEIQKPLEDLLESYKNKDVIEFSQVFKDPHPYLDARDISMTMDEVKEVAYDGFEYEISDLEEVDDENAIVSLKVKTKDLTPAREELLKLEVMSAMGEDSSKETLYQTSKENLLQDLEDVDDFVETASRVKLVKEDGKWYIDGDFENMLSLLSAVNPAIYGGAGKDFDNFKDEIDIYQEKNQEWDDLLGGLEEIEDGIVDRTMGESLQEIKESGLVEDMDDQVDDLLQKLGYLAEDYSDLSESLDENIDEIQDTLGFLDFDEDRKLALEMDDMQGYIEEARKDMENPDHLSYPAALNIPLFLRDTKLKPVDEYMEVIEAIIDDYREIEKDYEEVKKEYDKAYEIDMAQKNEQEKRQELVGDSRELIENCRKLLERVDLYSRESLEELSKKISELDRAIVNWEPIETINEAYTDLEEAKNNLKGVYEDLTKEEKRAIEAARQYLSILNFSRSGLVDQLQYDGHSEEDANTAIDYLEFRGELDWNEEALAQAKSYQEKKPMTDQELRDQLEQEGFTPEQISYAIENLE